MDQKEGAHEYYDVSNIRKIRYCKMIKTKITMYYFPDSKNNGVNTIGTRDDNLDSVTIYEDSKFYCYCFSKKHAQKYETVNNVAVYLLCC